MDKLKEKKVSLNKKQRVKEEKIEDILNILHLLKVFRAQNPVIEDKVGEYYDFWESKKELYGKTIWIKVMSNDPPVELEALGKPLEGAK